MSTYIEASAPIPVLLTEIGQSTYDLLTVLVTETVPPANTDTTDRSGGSSISGGYFSRKQWHALVGVMAAERAAREAAENAKKAKEAAALNKIAEQARAAHDLAKSTSADVERHLTLLTHSANAAITAGHLQRSKHVARMIEHHKAIQKAIAEAKAEEDDEQELLRLLML